jgi:ABC-type polysaccharide/polyol phosphate transport system ATPase subunit
MARVSLCNVTLEYPVYTSYTRTLRKTLYGQLGGRVERHNETVVIRALNDINIELGDGDRLGLLGQNGAGKTTLLRVISGVYEPVCGTVAVEGRVSALTDITLGMDPEATGWENIIFRSVFLGRSFAEARDMAPAIGAFSELGDYLDMPVRTYSSGMFLRLAFAISTSVNADILIMDEMIGAGDKDFIEKARRRIAELVDRTNIFVISSHDLDVIRMFTNKAVLLKHGEIQAIGPTDEVVDRYLGVSPSSAAASRDRAIIQERSPTAELELSL